MKTNNIVPKLRFPEFSGEWEEKKLEELGEIVSGSTPSTNNVEFFGGNISWITPKDLSNHKGIYISNGERNITEKGRNSCSLRLLPKNSILFSSRAPIGNLAIAQNLLCTNQGFKNIIPNNFVYFLFLYYLLEVNKKNIINFGCGGTFKEISLQTMQEIKVAISKNIQEQQKIADCLASLDELLDLEEKKLSALQKYKKGLLQKLFPQGESLVPEWRFPEFQNSGEWEEKKLGELGIFYRGHSYNANDVSSKGLLVLRSNNINNVINYNELQFVTKPCNIELLLQNEDIAICMSNGSKKLVGKSATFIVTDKYNYVTVGAFCSIFRSKNKLAKYLFQLNNYKEQINFILEGANINNLKNSELELFKFLLPISLQEQQKIADFLSGVDELIEKQQQKIELLKQHKKGLLQGLFPNMQLG